MSVDVWLKADLVNAIVATANAVARTQARGVTYDADVFNDGLRTGLTTLALKFGITAAELQVQARGVAQFVLTDGKP